MSDLKLMSPTLPDLAARIDATVRDAETYARSAVESALCAGRLLTEAKGQVPHGEWECWLLSNCKVTPRTAQAYMRLAKRVRELAVDEAQRVAELPLCEAMTAIGAKPDSPAPGARYRPRNEDSSKQPVFMRAARSAVALARDLGVRSIKHDRIRALREKLSDTVAELDRMLAEAKSNQIGEHDE